MENHLNYLHGEYQRLAGRCFNHYKEKGGTKSYVDYRYNIFRPEVQKMARLTYIPIEDGKVINN